MKKLFLLILVLTMVFVMCACEGVSDIDNIALPELPDVDSTTEPSVETQEPTPAVVSDACRITAYIQHNLEENYDPAYGEKRILSFAYDTLSLHIDSRDAATAAINEYIASVEETYYTGNDYGVGTAMGKSQYLTLAEDNYRYAYENDALDSNLEYSASRKVDITRADNSTVNIVYTDNDYTGGAHGGYSYEAFVFDSESGQRLTLDELSGDAEALRIFLTEQLAILAQQQDISERIDTELVPAEKLDEALASLLRDGSWYFDADGMVIFPDLYEISSYAAGIIEFSIPYSLLEGNIDVKWLPNARDAGGELVGKALEDVDGGTTEIIDKISADVDGRELCLVAEGSVYDVKLSRVEYSDIFYETERLWYCNELTDCAVQIVATIPDGMPNLMIRYTTASGEVVNRLISESGLDGSIVLVDDVDIEAVG